MVSSTIYRICVFAAIFLVSSTLAVDLYRYGQDNGDAFLSRTDTYSPALQLRWGLPFFNIKYWYLYINENGVVSFKNPVPLYSSTKIVLPIGKDEDTGRDQILAAPFWANVDLENQGYVYYRETTEFDLLDRATEDVRRVFVEFGNFRAKLLVIATWLDVGFWGESGGRKPKNTFQVVLATDEIETFCFFLYDRIEWTTGVESGGSGDTGTGGNAAVVGFNAGDGSSSYTEQYSGISSRLPRMVTESNMQSNGIWQYHVSRYETDVRQCNSAATLRTFPRFDSMMGHDYIWISGPCFDFRDALWLRYGGVDNPIAITKCFQTDVLVAWCIIPTFYQIGRLPIQLSRDDGDTYSNSGYFDIVLHGTVPVGVKRINPHSDSWLRPDRAIAIEWDANKINYTEVRVDILAYSEADGVPDWEQLHEVSNAAPNIGRFGWTAKPTYQIFDTNAVGIIRVTRRHQRCSGTAGLVVCEDVSVGQGDDNALWSDIHPLGYLLNDNCQRDPPVYANQKCEEWYEQALTEPPWDYDQDLNACPCNLNQAIADRARFVPDRYCDMNSASIDQNRDYCYLRDEVIHCVISVIPSPQGADSLCCYDNRENLVYAGDSFDGSFSRRVTSMGMPPYNSPKAVPTLSSWTHDGMRYFFCCVWGDHCDYYQEMRPTRDCRWYEPVRPAAVFGDPHVLTFDGVDITFNGKGEYTLLNTKNTQTSFTLQGRFEPIMDYKGDYIKATTLTAVAMREEDLDNINVRKSDRTVLEVVIGNELLEVETQTLILRQGVFLNFPVVYEDGNITQVIITYEDSQIGVIVNGTQDQLIVQVLMPDEFKEKVEGLLGTWDENRNNDLTPQGDRPISLDSSPETIFTNFGQTWLVSPASNSLFDYVVTGTNFDYYNDPDWVPQWSSPTNVPPGVDWNDIQSVCDGNKYCEFDIRTTGVLEFGKATKEAFEHYWLAHNASQEVVVCPYIPTPRNGTKTYESNQQNNLVGAHIMFACAEGYVLSGSEERVCQDDGEWTGEGDNNCVAMNCSTPDAISNGFIDIRYQDGELITETVCYDGYTLKGNAVRKCVDGKWTGKQATCDNLVAIILPVVFVVCFVVGIMITFVNLRRKNCKCDKRHASKLKSADVQHDKTSTQTFIMSRDVRVYSNVQDDFSFPREKLRILKELGHGQFGCVLLAEAEVLKGEGVRIEIAVKTLKEGASSADKEDFLRELKLMKILKPHPNVLGLLGCCVEADPYYVIVEYMANGNLKEFLIKSRKVVSYTNVMERDIQSSLTQTDLLMFAKQVADGMAFIAENKCIHRDLAARNILVGKDLICKIADFGLARDVMNIRVYERNSNTPAPFRWMALESILDNVYTTESDVWSFGVLLWEITTLGARPYADMASVSVIINKLKNGYRMPQPKHCQTQIYELMLACWAADLSRRPTFIQLSEQLDSTVDIEQDYIIFDEIDENIYDDVAAPDPQEKI